MGIVVIGAFPPPLLCFLLVFLECSLTPFSVQRYHFDCVNLSEDEAERIRPSTFTPLGKLLEKLILMMLDTYICADCQADSGEKTIREFGTLLNAPLLLWRLYLEASWSVYSTFLSHASLVCTGSGVFALA